MPRTSIPAVFREQVDKLRSRPMVYSKQDRHWRPLTWAQMGERVGHAAAGLCALGIEAGDRLGLLAHSTTEWVLCDLASATIGGVDVPISETTPAETVAFILRDSGCRLVFVGDRQLLDTVLAIR
ncbi:MAG: AMP-binding protein, partial [Myxococcales bacterium]|nr:AMP-binding protein [Myxococcales bacterium]